MTPEKWVKERVKRALREAGVWYCCPHGAGYGLPGIPDFICAVPRPSGPAQFLAIETKAGKNGLSSHQEARRREIEAVGGMYMVVREADIDLLPSILRRIRQ